MMPWVRTVIISAIAEAYREGHEKMEKETAKAAASAVKTEEAKKAAEAKAKPVAAEGVGSRTSS